MSRPTAPPDVLLTGACGGIGKAVAARYLRAGSRVALLGRDEAVLDDLRATAPDRARAYTPDVTDVEQMLEVAEDWCAAFGVPDVVIANAGVAGGFDTAAVEDLAVMRRMLEINLLGVATTFHPFVSPMRDRRTGTLVGIASVAGWRGLPGNGAYSASKGGLIRYLESLRTELRPHGVRVVTMSPGYVRTALTAGNTMRMPGLLEADDAAARIVEAIDRGRERVTVPRRTGLVSRALAVLPGTVQDRVLLGQPRKPRVGEPGATEIPGL
ncbi:MAG TPA: SDR family oxidoreductase [Nocardioidaceae bacterium]|nr:SDR family oxidoreductase [Nocardioidaceae bacterium]